jgi:hypothetical protein
MAMDKDFVGTARGQSEEELVGAEEELVGELVGAEEELVGAASAATDVTAETSHIDDGPCSSVSGVIPILLHEM